jgi:hypothetical protein
MNKFMGLENEVLKDWRQVRQTCAAPWQSPDLAASPPEGWTLFILDREFIPGLNCALQYSVFIGKFPGTETLSPHPSKKLQSLHLALRQPLTKPAALR